MALDDGTVAILVAESNAKYREKLPKPRDVWVHHEGGRYVIFRCTNLGSLTDRDPSRRDRFPISVVYFAEGFEMDPDRWYSRKADDFMRSFTRG